MLSHDAVASERHGERAVRGESTEHGDEHPNPTQDRQCCAMEPRGKALERGAAERAEARTVAERSTGEAGGRSKRELLLEAYYSTPCSCCTCTAALLYVHFSAAAGGDRRRCSGRTIARLDVHRRRCWTCPVGPTGRALLGLLFEEHHQGCFQERTSQQDPIPPRGDPQVRARQVRTPPSLAQPRSQDFRSHLPSKPALLRYAPRQTHAHAVRRSPDWTPPDTSRAPSDQLRSRP